jgi:nicotinamide riboside kinase
MKYENYEVKKQILDKIKEYNKIFIFRHKRPDGDATGSTKGLKRILELTYPEKEIKLQNCDFADYMAFLEGQYNLNKKLINSPANHGVFFADTDSMVTRMYAEYYAKDDTCALTQEEFEKVAVMADELARKSRWDKIFLVAPHGVFVDDHERYMAHSGMKERQELFDILVQNIKRTGDWDKVVILTGNYYENFMAVVNYVNEVMAR